MEFERGAEVDLAGRGTTFKLVWEGPGDAAVDGRGKAVTHTGHGDAVVGPA